MSRPLRIEYPGAWYHVMNRGRRREDIYQDEEDFHLFLKVLQDTAKMWNLKVSAYCLMNCPIPKAFGMGFMGNTK